MFTLNKEYKGIDDETIKIMENEKKWNSLQQFIQDAVNNRIKKWYREHAVG
jgi:hypothetical protein